MNVTSYDDDFTLSDAMAIVREHRKNTKDWFPFGNVATNTRYMVQELGETDDAMMRKNRPNDVRASAKTIDVNLEIGQVAYMMLSAFVASETDHSMTPRMLHYLNTVNGIIRATIDGNQELAYSHLCALAEFANVNLETVLKQAMSNIDSRKK